MTPEELRDLVRTARELGVKTLRLGENVIELGPEPRKPMTAEERKRVAEQMMRKKHSKEDMMLWHTDGPLPSEVDELKAKIAAQTEEHKTDARNNDQ